MRHARATLTLAVVVLMATFAFQPSPVGAATALPTHVYIPYFETWTADSITTVAQASGVSYFTLAFLETLGKRSCTLAWNGARGQTVADGRYLSDISSLRAIGGDVIPSFGGWSADQGGTEIGDSCKDVNAIVAAYKELVTTYDVSRLDMDIEGRSLTRTEGIDRRNKALKLLQKWAKATGRTLQIQYTLPTSADGLESSGLAVLQNAIANGVRVRVVNPMVFDYYDHVTTDMGAAAVSRVEGPARAARNALPGQDERATLGDAGRHDHERCRRFPAGDRGHRSRRRPAAPELRAAEGDEHAVDVGDPARQRRLPRRRRSERLLGHRPGHVGVQPPARALHRTLKARAPAGR